MGGTRGGRESTETEHIEGVDTSGSSSGRGRFRGSGFRVQGSGFGMVRVSEANLEQRHCAMQTDADVRFLISFVKTTPPTTQTEQQGIGTAAAPSPPTHPPPSPTQRRSAGLMQLGC